MLLDEPISALDANLRAELHVEPRELRQIRSKTFILVLQALDGALVVSETIAVIKTQRPPRPAAPRELATTRKSPSSPGAPAPPASCRAFSRMAISRPRSADANSLNPLLGVRGRSRSDRNGPKSAAEVRGATALTPKSGESYPRAAISLSGANRARPG